MCMNRREPWENVNSLFDWLARLSEDQLRTVGPISSILNHYSPIETFDRLNAEERWDFGHYFELGDNLGPVASDLICRCLADFILIKGFILTMSGKLFLKREAPGYAFVLCFARVAVGGNEGAEGWLPLDEVFGLVRQWEWTGENWWILDSEIVADGTDGTGGS